MNAEEARRLTNIKARELRPKEVRADLNKFDDLQKKSIERGGDCVFEITLHEDAVKELKRQGYKVTVYKNSTQTLLYTISW